MNRPFLDRPVPAPWPPMQAVAVPSEPLTAADRLRRKDRVAFWAAVAMVLIFSQGWQLPLVRELPSTNTVLLQGGFFPAYGIALAIIFGSLWNATRATLRQPFLIMLMIVVVASVTWSVDPSTSARRAFAVVCTSLAGIALAGRFRWAVMADVLATAFAILVLASFFTGIAWREIGVMREIFPGAWRGLWIEKNILGGIMAQGFGIFGAAAMLNPKRAKLWCVFAVLAAVLLILSQSKTSLVAMMIGAAAIGFIYVVQRGPAIGTAALWLAVTGAAVLAGFVFLASDVFFGLLGKDATFTGRTRIWSAIIRQVEQRPWTGFGYSAVWSDTSGRGPFAWIVKEAGFTPEHAHNSWLEQWLGLGFFGLVAWGMFFLQTMALALIAVFRTKGAYLAFPFLLIFSLQTLTESIAVVYNDFRWTLFVAFAIKLAFPDRELDAKKA